MTWTGLARIQNLLTKDLILASLYQFLIIYRASTSVPAWHRPPKQWATQTRSDQYLRHIWRKLNADLQRRDFNLLESTLFFQTYWGSFMFGFFDVLNDSGMDREARSFFFFFFKINSSFQNSFRFTGKLWRQNREFPHAHIPSFPIFNILHWSSTFITINKPIVIHQY